MAAEIEIQLFKKLRYANVSGITRIRIKTTVNEKVNGAGTGASNVVNSPIYTVLPGSGTLDIDGDTVTVPYGSFYVSKVEAVFKKEDPPVPAGSVEIDIPGTATMQIPNLVVLTSFRSWSVVAFDGDTNAAVISGSCWLQP